MKKASTQNSASESHAFIKVDDKGKVVESSVMNFMKEKQAKQSSIKSKAAHYVKCDPDLHNLFVWTPKKIDKLKLVARSRDLLTRSIDKFFSMDDKSDVIKNGLRLSVRERDFAAFELIKEELSKAIQCKVILKKRLSREMKEQLTKSIKQPEGVSDRALYLFNKAVNKFFSMDDKSDVIKNGLRLSVREKDFDEFKSIQKELSEAISCPVYVDKRAPKGEGTSNADRKNYLFNKAVKSFNAIEDKADILKNGLSISVREEDWPLMQLIQDELSKEIKCPVKISKREKKSPESPTGQDVQSLQENKKRGPRKLVKYNFLPTLARSERSWLETLLGPFSSTIIHIALIVGLALLLQDRIIETPAEIEITIAEEEEIPDEEPPVVEEPILEAVKDANSLTPELTNVVFEELEKTEVEVINDMEELASTDDAADIVALNDIVLSPSAFVSRSILAGRSGSGRNASVAKFGGSIAGQESLMKALWWLKKVQNPDGSWGNGNGTKTAMTGLALLTFLAHGETDDSMNFGETVKRAVNYLLDDPININVQNAYPHAIKTYALAEAYAMIGLVAIKIRMEECVKIIVNGQQKGGAFNYRYSLNERRQDLSFSGWNFQALKAAYSAGSEVEGLAKAIYQSIKWLQNMSYGRFSYTTANNNVVVGEASHTMRAVGVLCLQLFGHRNFDGIVDDLEFMAKKDLAKYKWQNAPHEALYGWYYATQAMFQAGGDLWKSWNDVFQDVLINNQHMEGYWDHPGKYHGPNDEMTSRVYATTLCALQLTVYYRYLPSFKNDGAPIYNERRPDVEEGIDLVE